MRELIETVKDGFKMDGHAVDGPPEYDPDDQPHYDALAKTGFFGENGSGALIVARSTGRCLFMLRSEDVQQPHTYGNCGGAFKIDEEEPHVAADREVREESGYTGEYTLIPAYIFRKPGFTYYNFFAIVEDEFEPRLNWESDDYVWAKPEDHPEPLHFGLVALFADAESRAKLNFDE